MPAPGPIHYGSGWQGAPRWVAPLLAALMVALLCWIGFAIWTAWRAEQQATPAGIQKPEA